MSSSFDGFVPLYSNLGYEELQDSVTILAPPRVGKNGEIMKTITKHSMFSVLVLFAILIGGLTASSQTKTDFEVLNEAGAAKVVPASFYFAGQSAQTQQRNAAAARIGKDRFVISGMVDTSGYSTEISGKYEGFFITDSPISFGGNDLSPGAYGFGFSKEGKLTIFDVGARTILSVDTQVDSGMKRPRPLQMISDSKGIRFYKGRNYVLIEPR